MCIESMISNLENFRNKAFRDLFQKKADSEDPPTLSDEESALLFVASRKRATETKTIAEMIPPATREKFEEFINMRTKKGKFFERFCFLSRNENDGVVIGVGFDEVYYVLITWDINGADTWKPKADIYDNKVL